MPSTSLKTDSRIRQCVAGARWFMRRHWGALVLAAAFGLGCLLIAPISPESGFLWLTRDARYDLGSSLLGGAVIGVAVLAVDASFQAALRRDDARREQAMHADRIHREREQERQALRIQLGIQRSTPGIDLAEADLHGFYLRGHNFQGARLTEADLRRADLERADLAGANLSGADLSEARLRGADLSRSFLFGTAMARADLSGADLAGASGLRPHLLDGAIYDDDTTLPPDLPNANPECPGPDQCETARTERAVAAQWAVHDEAEGVAVERDEHGVVWPGPPHYHFGQKR